MPSFKIEKLQIGYKILNSNAKPPTYANQGDSGADIRCINDYVFAPLQRALVSTGISLELPQGFEFQIRPLSGLANKHGITVLNAPGTIDSGYRGEVKVLLANISNNEVRIRAGQRIAQLVLAEVRLARFVEVMVLSKTERGAKGFGSSGK